MAENFGPTDRGTARPSDTIQHPYKRFEGSPQWRVIDKAIDDLVGNDDIEERTNRAYIVGYLCHMLASSATP